MSHKSNDQFNEAKQEAEQEPMKKTEKWETRFREKWDKAMEPILDEQFPKDNLGVENERPSFSRRGAALVLYAQAYIFAEKFIRSTISQAITQERERNKGIVLLCYRDESDREARIFNEALDLVYSRISHLQKETK